MSFPVIIDLSAKVEHWIWPSAIAVSNGATWTLLVTSKVKQQVRKVLKQRHGTRNLQLRVLAVLIYLAIQEHLPEISHLVLDRDYSGQAAEATIKNFLLPLVRQIRPDVGADFIWFANVKGSKADKRAKQVFDQIVKPDRVLTYLEMEKALKVRP